ncbi:MAG: glycosyltransferase [Pseudomonadota bacterium]
MTKLRTLYFTGVDVGVGNGGGEICCRNHIRSLTEDPEIDLILVVTAPKTSEEATRALAARLDVPLTFIPSEEIRKSDPLRHLRYLSRKFPFSYEKNLRHKRHIDRAFAVLLETAKPDVVIVDHLPSALYVPSLYASSVPRCVVKLNREAEFHRDAHQNRGDDINSPLMKLAFARWSRIEETIQSESDGVIALTVNDLPTDGSRPKVAVAIPPFLDAFERQWSYTGNKRVGFVGHIGHFPNKLAIEWLCVELAPCVARLDPDIRFRVIGAGPGDVPAGWLQPNVGLFGRGERQFVEDEFTQNDLFLAPILNNYGSKIKLLECVAFGAPFLATPSALSGLSFLQLVPTIDLANPQASAKTLVDLVNGNGALVALSEGIRWQVGDFRRAQQGVWGRTLKSVIEAASDRRSN